MLHSYSVIIPNNFLHDATGFLMEFDICHYHWYYRLVLQTIQYKYTQKCISFICHKEDNLITSFRIADVFYGLQFTKDNSFHDQSLFSMSYNSLRTTHYMINSMFSMSYNSLRTTHSMINPMFSMSYNSLRTTHSMINSIFSMGYNSLRTTHSMNNQCFLWVTIH